MMNQKPAWLILSLIGALFLATLAPALEAQQSFGKIGPKRTQKILQDFKEQIRKIDELILAEKTWDAYESANRLLRRMIDVIVSGPELGRLLGLVTVLRAIAAHQLGREDEALWHWHVATQMFPGVSDMPMSAYGETETFFKSHPLPDLKTGSESHEGSESAGVVTPPKKKRAPQPYFPVAKRRGQRISVVVQVLIGKDGRVREPRIIESEGELTLVCAALDAYRKWEFKPALKGGEPVEVYYSLKVNFGRR